jgi:drug/metabolite transporter (DMT)-like permease
MSEIIAFILAISLSAITVVGDLFVKESSLSNNVWNKWLLFGAAIYGLTAIGWVYVMKSIKLSTLGTIYGISLIILLTLSSIFILHEKLSIPEVIGIVLGIISLILLYRFS